MTQRKIGRFTVPLILRDGIKWTVERGFSYIRNDGTRIFVPKGFETDLASIPQLAQSFIPKVHFSYNQPAVVHDWLYHLSRIGRETCTRKQADETFREAILTKEAQYNVEYSVADAMFHAVRVGAWSKWKDRRFETEIEDDFLF